MVYFSIIFCVGLIPDVRVRVLSDIRQLFCHISRMYLFKSLPAAQSSSSSSWTLKVFSVPYCFHKVP